MPHKSNEGELKTIEELLEEFEEKILQYSIEEIPSVYQKLRLDCAESKAELLSRMQPSNTKSLSHLDKKYIYQWLIDNYPFTSNVFVRHLNADEFKEQIVEYIYDFINEHLTKDK